tara:strand:+ start:1289 stop:1642 length:354 start_codon:yes stop_codon:yes gene_type:complete
MKSEKTEDDKKKEMLSRKREYIPGSTVSEVVVDVITYRAYIDKQTKQKIFETVDVSSKQFSAKIPSDDALEAAEIVSGNLEKNQSAWDVFDSIESENEMLRQISEEQHKQKNISDDE